MTQLILVLHLTETLMGRIWSLVGAMVSRNSGAEAPEVGVTLQVILANEAKTIQVRMNIKNLLLQSRVLS